MKNKQEQLRKDLSALTTNYYRQANPLAQLHEASENLEGIKGFEESIIGNGLIVLFEELEKQYVQVQKLMTYYKKGGQNGR